MALPNTNEYLWPYLIRMNTYGHLPNTNEYLWPYLIRMNTYGPLPNTKVYILFMVFYLTQMNTHSPGHLVIYYNYVETRPDEFGAVRKLSDSICSYRGFVPLPVLEFTRFDTSHVNLKGNKSCKFEHAVSNSFGPL
jgi:hypothetical protein